MRIFIYTIIALYLLTLILHFTLGENAGLKDNKASEKTNQESVGLYGIGENGEAAQYEFARLQDPSTGNIPFHIREKELLFAAGLPKKEDFSRSLSWQSRGPNNFGGRTRAIAFDVNDPNIIIAGGVTGSIYRSINGGASFSPVLTPDQLHSVTCIVQDKRSGKTNNWYCGTGEYYGINSAASFSNLFSGNGIYHSTDGGLHWSLISSTASNTPATHSTLGDFDIVWDIVIDNQNTSQDVILAAVYGGIYRSNDGGVNWTPVLGLDTTTSNISDYVDLLQTPGGVFYAALSNPGPDKGVWRSRDGVNWVRITPVTFPAQYDRIEMAYAPSDETQIFVIANTPSSGVRDHQLWKYKYSSGDGSGTGGTWMNRSAYIPNGNCTGFYDFNFGYYNSQSGYDMCIAVKPDDTLTVLLGGTSIYRSRNAFTSNAYDWIAGYQCDTLRPSNYVWPNQHPDQHKFLFHPTNSNRFYAVTDGGIFGTDNVLATVPIWINYNNNYNTAQFYTIAIEPGNTSSNILVGGLQDNGTWFNDGIDPFTPWKHVFYGDGAYCAIAHDHKTYYLSWQSGHTFKFDIDGSGTVNGMERIDPTGGGQYQFINPFILDPTDDNIMYLAGGRYIWRNDSLGSIAITGNEYNDKSQGWRKLFSTATGSGFNSPVITALTMSPADHNKLYYGTDKGSVYVLDTARSNTIAKRLISSSAMPAGAYVSSISADPLDANKILVSFSNYGVKSIFYTTDGGANWTDVSANLEERVDGTGNGPSVNWVHIYNDGATQLFFAGTSTGLYSTSSLSGASTVWAQEGPSSIGNCSVTMVTSRSHDGFIAVATHGRGVYTFRLKDVASVASNVTGTNVNLTLYPNPSADKVSALFETSEAGNASWIIYDISGRKVAEGETQKMNPGKNTFELNALSDKASGILAGHYLFVLKQNGKMFSTPLIRM